MPNSFLDLKNQIDESLKKNEIDLSIQLCSDYLETTKDSEALALLESLQQLKKQENRQIVDLAIEESKKFWETKEYEKLYSLYLKLRKIAPNYDKLEFLIGKLNLALNQTKNQENSALEKDFGRKIKALRKEKKYLELMRFAENFLAIDQGNVLAKKTYDEALSAFLGEEIKKIKKTYYGENKFDLALSALLELLNKYGEEGNLIREIVACDKKNIEKVNSIKKREIIDGLEKCDKFLAEGKVNEALILFSEIKKNSTLAKDKLVLRKDKILQKKLDQKRDLEIISYLKAKNQALKEDFKGNPNKYLAI